MIMCELIAQLLTRISAQEDRIVGLSRGGLWEGVGGGVALPIDTKTQGVFGFPGQEAVPVSVTQHQTRRNHRHSSCTVVHGKHHLRKKHDRL